jgi:hypothetical protein
LETGDAGIAPGDAAETARGFEDELVVYGLGHDTASAFSMTLKIVWDGLCFNPFLARAGLSGKIAMRPCTVARASSPPGSGATVRMSVTPSLSGNYVLFLFLMSRPSGVSFGAFWKRRGGS